MKPTLLKRIAIVASCAVAFLSQPLRASIAYGSINNFDTVNDTGHDCHGFEIEIEDCRSTDISYTYDYNHYGTSKITQDDSIPGHPKCLIRWASKKNPDGTWASHTAIPSGPIHPTDGHQFTNPAVNFGGEHFGVGYNVAVGAVRYNWLIDDGAGNLVSGGAVQVSTPVYTYYPPFNGGVPQVQAVIAPPPPEVPEAKEFGKAVWVKEIRTTSHNNNEVKLRDLVSDDPDDADDKNWKNGEPDEVETEWQILQKDTGKADGGPNNEVPAAAENLPGGDEVVTRRYEFYKYIGPIDDESGEAMGSSVGQDGIHGIGVKIINGVETDLSTVEVVGEFTGSQMAAVDVDAPVGLIDHVSEASVNEPFAARTVVVEGAFPFVCMMTGDLPAGMEFDDVTGVLSGTPAESGEFNFSITASDIVNPDVSKNYTLLVAAAGAALPPSSIVDTVCSPVGAGTTTGDGAFDPGSQVTATASPLAGFRFVNWTDNGTVVSNTASYTFTIDVSHSLVANFTMDLPQWSITTGGAPAEGGVTTGGGMVNDGASATLIATPNAGYSFVNWTENGVEVSTSATHTFTATVNRALLANFTQVPTFVITTGSNPAAGGTTTGDGSFASGSSATVTATANDGYVFTKWTVGGNQVSTLPAYTFTVTASRNLVANFVIAGTQQTIATSASPLAWGTTIGGGNYASGDSATVVATANPGYAFSKWQEGNSNVSTSSSYTFTVAGDRTLTAKFIEAFVITANVSPSVGGTTEMDSLTYKTGENAKASATPAAGYGFANWTDNGVIVSTDSSYSFNVTGNRTLVANFTSNSGFTINTSSAPAAGGATTGDGVYANGSTASLTAEANPGYAFNGWTENAADVSAPAAYDFTVTASRTLVAKFIALPAIATSAGAPGSNTVTLTWPAANAGWVLEESPDLAAWTASSRPVTTSGDQNSVTVDTSGRCLYFRLAHP